MTREIEKPERLWFGGGEISPQRVLVLPPGGQIAFKDRAVDCDAEPGRIERGCVAHVDGEDPLAGGWNLAEHKTNGQGIHQIPLVLRESSVGYMARRCFS